MHWSLEKLQFLYKIYNGNLKILYFFEVFPFNALLKLSNHLFLQMNNYSVYNWYNFCYK